MIPPAGGYPDGSSTMSGLLAGDMKPTLMRIERAALIVVIPIVIVTAPQLSSGFDYWSALSLVRGVPYGSSSMHAYPLPIYLPFAALGLLSDPWPTLVAPLVCIAFLAAGLWLWGARRAVILLATLMSPVGLGVVVNSNFNCAVAIFGIGLAVWAKQAGRAPLVGLGIALSLWRPTNCLPAIAVLLASGWRWRDLAQAIGAFTLVTLPLTALAFLVQPDWLVAFRGVLTADLDWAGLGPHLLQATGPFGYAAAQAAIGVAGIFLLRRRTLAEATAFALALTVLLGTIAGAYSGSLALPALVLVAEDARYAALPAVAAFIGWAIAFVLIRINFPVGVVSYWYVIQAYPLLRRRSMTGLGAGSAPHEHRAPHHLPASQTPPSA